MKSIFTTVALSAMLLAGSASLAFADCAGDIKASTDMAMKAEAAKKDAGMKEIAMASDAMTKKDDAGCKMHTDAAMAAMK